MATLSQARFAQVPPAERLCRHCDYYTTMDLDFEGELFAIRCGYSGDTAWSYSETMAIQQAHIFGVIPPRS